MSHSSTLSSLLKQYDTTEQTGLSSTQVSAQLVIHGQNVLPEQPATPIWHLILAQFQDQLVLILLGAAGISFVLAALETPGEGEQITAFVEPIVILLILIANAVVGVVQESNAEAAIDVCLFLFIRDVKSRTSSLFFS
jgi:Ca2+ transporting ATPase